MKYELEESTIECPYCGEPIPVLVDCSIPHQSYIEDCQVCCRPINLDVLVNHDESVTIKAMHENEWTIDTIIDCIDEWMINKVVYVEAKFKPVVQQKGSNNYGGYGFSYTEGLTIVARKVRWFLF